MENSSLLVVTKITYYWYELVSTILDSEEKSKTRMTSLRRFAHPKRAEAVS